MCKCKCILSCFVDIATRRVTILIEEEVAARSRVWINKPSEQTDSLFFLSTAKILSDHRSGKKTKLCLRILEAIGDPEIILGQGCWIQVSLGLNLRSGLSNNWNSGPVVWGDVVSSSDLKRPSLFFRSESAESTDDKKGFVSQYTHAVVGSKSTHARFYFLPLQPFSAATVAVESTVVSLSLSFHSLDQGKKERENTAGKKRSLFSHLSFSLCKWTQGRKEKQGSWKILRSKSVSWIESCERWYQLHECTDMHH